VDGRVVTVSANGGSCASRCEELSWWWLVFVARTLWR